MAFILILIGLLGAAGTCGGLEMDSITMTQAMVLGAIFLTIMGAGCAGSNLGGDEDEGEKY